MNFYLDAQYIDTIQEAKDLALKQNNGFFVWENDLFHKDTNLGSLESCLDTGYNLSDKLIFNTTYKIWGHISKANLAFQDSGYPFILWNDKIFDRDLKEVAVYSEIMKPLEKQSKFIF